MMRMYVLMVSLGLLIQESLPLSMLHVVVPAYRVRGQSAQFECEYSLGADTLYSVKWYRDNEEFYRYMPKYDPPKHAYKLDGIKVDLQKSDARRVTLHQVTLKSSGVYRCEVSAEAPSFASTAGEGRMEVIYLPKEGPRITGNEQENRKGDSLFLNCTSGRSYPAAVLSWDIDGEKTKGYYANIRSSNVSFASADIVDIGGLFCKARWTLFEISTRRKEIKSRINQYIPRERRCDGISVIQRQVTDPELLVEYPLTQHSHGLLSSALGLRVPVGRSMQVRCTARVAPAWREGSEAVVGSSHMTDSKEAMLLVRSSAASTLSVTLLTLSLALFLALKHSET